MHCPTYGSRAGTPRAQNRRKGQSNGPQSYAYHRPVFEIDNDVVKAELTDTESSLMARLVKDNATRINETIPAIGRIDLPGDENYPWARTSWVVDSELSIDELSAVAN